VCSYNLAGISFTPKQQIAEEIKKHIPKYNYLIPLDFNANSH
jgi:hypothetical protein